MSLKKKVKAIDNGRFIELADVLSFKDVCLDCCAWDSRREGGYRCACLGHCPGITLSDKMKDYIKKYI